MGFLSLWKWFRTIGSAENAVPGSEFILAIFGLVQQLVAAKFVLFSPCISGSLRMDVKAFSGTFSRKVEEVCRIVVGICFYSYAYY